MAKRKNKTVEHAKAAIEQGDYREAIKILRNDCFKSVPNELDFKLDRLDLRQRVLASLGQQPSDEDVDDYKLTRASVRGALLRFCNE